MGAGRPPTLAEQASADKASFERAMEQARLARQFNELLARRGGELQAVSA